MIDGGGLSRPRRCPPHIRLDTNSVVIGLTNHPLGLVLVCLAQIDGLTDDGTDDHANAQIAENAGDVLAGEVELFLYPSGARAEKGDGFLHRPLGDAEQVEGIASNVVRGGGEEIITPVWGRWCF